MNQARQLIVHGHVALKGNKITVPSYLVRKEEEGKISFRLSSPLSKEDHPERAKERKEDVIKRKSSIVKKTEDKKEDNVPKKEKIENGKEKPNQE